MQVEVARSGGYAGVAQTARLGDADVDDATSHALRALAERHPQGAGTAGPAPDRFQYDVRLEEEGWAWHGTLREQDLQPQERALLEGLLRQSPRG